MKAWRFYGFNDMRLDDVPDPALREDHVVVEILCIQPSVTEAQLAHGISTVAYDDVKRKLETEAPVLTDAVQAQNLTNEGGVEGTNRLLKNIAGLWLLESCRKAWAAQGYSLGLDALEAALITAPARRAWATSDNTSLRRIPSGPAPTAWACSDACWP